MDEILTQTPPLEAVKSAIDIYYATPGRSSRRQADHLRGSIGNIDHSNLTDKQGKLLIEAAQIVEPKAKQAIEIQRTYDELDTKRRLMDIHPVHTPTTGEIVDVITPRGPYKETFCSVIQKFASTAFPITDAELLDVYNRAKETEDFETSVKVGIDKLIKAKQNDIGIFINGLASAEHAAKSIAQGYFKKVEDAQAEINRARNIYDRSKPLSNKTQIDLHINYAVSQIAGEPKERDLFDAIANFRPDDIGVSQLYTINYKRDSSDDGFDMIENQYGYSSKVEYVYSAIPHIAHSTSLDATRKEYDINPNTINNKISAVLAEKVKSIGERADVDRACAETHKKLTTYDEEFASAVAQAQQKVDMVIEMQRRKKAFDESLKPSTIPLLTDGKENAGETQRMNNDLQSVMNELSLMMISLTSGNPLDGNRVEEIMQLHGTNSNVVGLVGALRNIESMKIENKRLRTNLDQSTARLAQLDAERAEAQNAVGGALKAAEITTNTIREVNQELDWQSRRADNSAENERSLAAEMLERGRIIQQLEGKERDERVARAMLEMIIQQKNLGDHISINYGENVVVSGQKIPFLNGGISKNHANISFSDAAQAFVITDNNSRNGTKVNGKVVKFEAESIVPSSIVEFANSEDQTYIAIAIPNPENNRRELILVKLDFDIARSFKTLPDYMQSKFRVVAEKIYTTFAKIERAKSVVGKMNTFTQGGPKDKLEKILYF